MKKILYFTMGLTLSACSLTNQIDEPSEKEIKSAFANNMKANNGLDNALCLNIALKWNSGKRLCPQEYVEKYRSAVPSDTMSFEEYQNLSQEEKTAFDDKANSSMKDMFSDISKDIKKIGNCQSTLTDRAPVDLEDASISLSDKASVAYECIISLPVKITQNEYDNFVQSNLDVDKKVSWESQFYRKVRIEKHKSEWAIVGIGDN